MLLIFWACVIVLYVSLLLSEQLKAPIVRQIEIETVEGNEDDS